MHPGQLSISPAAVRELVEAQFPQWRGLPVTPVRSQGTVNAIVRIGERLAARFPLQPGDPEAVRRSLEAEAAAAAELLGRTRFATPEPVAIGEPGAGYPLPWSVQTWVPGDDASRVDPGGSVGFAHDLAAFISQVRAIPARGRTFSGGGRGGDLRDRAEWMATSIEASRGLLDVPLMRCLWAEMIELPRDGSPDVMSHSDLIPGNVLVRDGRLAGVLDVGGFKAADPALDLVGAWHLLEAGPRRELREALACGDLEWARGRAWAFEQAMGAAWYYRESNPGMSRWARRTLERIAAEPV
ncbi:phosphotransferase [Glycomyces terrestris]|uniref:Aminoglycoside phosphotransferase n=1 Tax=Glycomyces terrestris TaxID=2493553 RepID=A0A426V5V3_9ACTN|nr:aminoglycoside phosphotransferase [Glycomyces terrestris]